MHCAALHTASGLNRKERQPLSSLHAAAQSAALGTQQSVGDQTQLPDKGSLWGLPQVVLLHSVYGSSSASSAGFKLDKFVCPQEKVTRSDASVSHTPVGRPRSEQRVTFPSGQMPFWQSYSSIS